MAAEMAKMGLASDLLNYPDADYKHLEKPTFRNKLSREPKNKGTKEEQCFSGKIF